MSAGPALAAAVPVLRIYDRAKALEFYCDFLGCTLDWEHRFADDLPLYMQVSRGGMILHLSEHYGDGTPGSVVWVKVTEPRALFAELLAKQARFARPGANKDEATLTDPFGNMIRFVGSRG